MTTISTKDSQRLLRRAAHAALTAFGITPRRMTLVAHRHNDVFRVNAVTGERFALRIQNRLLSDAQMKSQLTWLAALAQDTTLRVPSSVRTTDGRPFTHVETADGPRRAVVLRWLEGMPAKKHDDKTYRAAATMIAQLHNHAMHFRPSQVGPCRNLDAEWLFGDRYFARAKCPHMKLDASQRRVMSRAERCVRGAMEMLGQTPSRYGLIHADLNLDNILFHHGIPCPIDFDEFGTGWYLFDLAELIRTSVSAENWRARKAFAMHAYRQTRSVDAAEADAFDGMLIATFVQYLNWAFVHARGKNDLKWVGYCVDVVRKIISA